MLDLKFLAAKEFPVFKIVISILLLPLFSFAGTGTFSLVKGAVYVKKANQKEKKARRGLKLHEGGSVRTAEGAYAKITMSDKNVIHVGPKTEFVLTQYQTEDDAVQGVKESQLSVLYGKVRTALEQKYDGEKSRFRVTTEAAVLGVRGTDFITEHSSFTQQTRAVTLEGLVRVTGLDDNGNVIGGRDLAAGEMILVQAGESPLSPVELPNDILEEFSQGSTTSSKKSSVKKTAEKKIDQRLKSAAVIENLPERLREGERTGLPKHLLERNIISSSSGDAEVTIDVEDNS